jgi:hypothetical protein
MMAPSFDGSVLGSSGGKSNEIELPNYHWFSRRYAQDIDANGVFKDDRFVRRCLTIGSK